jgi:HPt (histidine-containing phosphotransfer) domain-containing protein
LRRLAEHFTYEEFRFSSGMSYADIELKSNGDRPVMQNLPEATALMSAPKTTVVVIFNPSTLKELCEATGEPLEWLVENLCEPFIQDAVKSLKTIEDAIKNRDAKALEYIAHRMKGSSGSAGALSLAHHYHKLMEAGRKEEFDGLSDVLTELRIHVDYGRHEVEIMKASSAA